jgi:hypothetical protein
MVFFALAAAGFAATPTFSKDVAPILFEHCVTCHRPGDIGPMALLTYDQVRPWAKAIRSEVALGRMPPWHATQPHGVFSNDRRLSDHDRATLLAWAEGGAPEGDPKDLPAAPRFADGWEIGTPDAVITMPRAFKVPAWTAVPYQYFAIATGFADDKWVQAIEVRPGARSVVHHVVITCRAPGDAREQEAFTQAFPETTFLTHGVTPIAVVVPGTNVIKFPSGSALKIKAGSILTLQIHYNARDEPAEDMTSVGLIFAKEPPRLEIQHGVFVNMQFVLLPGAPDTEVDSAIEFSQDAHIWGLGQHTHLRGKSWEYRMVYPDGRRQVILSIPHYDPNWQTYYQFATPVAAPKGARLEAVAHFDNSENNPLNPDPRAAVRWGEQTWQEMQFSVFSYTLDQPPGQSGTAVAPRRN